DVQYTGGQACLVENFGDLQSEQRDFLGWFQDERVAGAKRHADLLGTQNQREVERRYSANDTERSTDSERQKSRDIRWNDLSEYPAGFSGGSANHVNGEGHFELRFAERRARFIDQNIHDLSAPCFQNLGSADQNDFALRR